VLIRESSHVFPSFFQGPSVRFGQRFWRAPRWWSARGMDPRTRDDQGLMEKKGPRTTESHKSLCDMWHTCMHAYIYIYLFIH
jgi:hypothetical protein